MFSFFFLLEGERKGDDSYHDEGRVVGISLERVRGGQRERESENIANIQNIILAKKKKKKSPTQPFKQCTTTSTFPSTNNPSNSSVQILFELNSGNVLT